ncbi:MAG: adenylosuccinate lyase [bacterium]|nr:adenylosuccinate lyase [bacterium]
MEVLESSFENEEAGMIERYTPADMSELWSDQSKFNTWLEVEIETLTAKENVGLTSRGVTALTRERASFTVEDILVRDREIEHDLQAFVDVVRKSLGCVASRFHEDMTSFDVVDTAQALLLKRSGELILARVGKLKVALRRLAEKHALTLRVGRTHGVHGEPITFGFEVLNWLHMICQAEELLETGFRLVAVGKLSGAMGVYTLDPDIEEAVCHDLGLSRPKITTQILSRTAHAQLFSAMGVIASVLDKIAQDIRSAQRIEVSELEEPRKEGQKGSSAMPHKRNPVICERISGLARVLRNNAGVGLENIVTWDERDIAQSSAERVAMVDSLCGLAYILDRMIWVIEGLKVNAGKMLENLGLTQGCIYSQAIKTHLVMQAREQGVDLDPDAIYGYIQSCAFSAMAERLWLLDVMEETDLPNRLPLSALTSREALDALTDPWRNLKYLPRIFARFDISISVPDGQ